MKARHIKIGDLVRVHITPQAFIDWPQWPDNAPEVCGLGTVQSVGPSHVWVRWEGEENENAVPRSALVVVPYDNPHTDLPHCWHYRPSATQRVISDRLLDRGRPKASRAVLRRPLLLRWKPKRQTKQVWLCSGSGPVTLRVEDLGGRVVQITNTDDGQLTVEGLDGGVVILHGGRLTIRDSMAAFQRGMAQVSELTAAAVREMATGIRAEMERLQRRLERERRAPRNDSVDALRYAFEGLRRQGPSGGTTGSGFSVDGFVQMIEAEPGPVWDAATVETQLSSPPADRAPPPRRTRPRNRREWWNR